MKSFLRPSWKKALLAAFAFYILIYIFALLMAVPLFARCNGNDGCAAGLMLLYLQSPFKYLVALVSLDLWRENIFFNIVTIGAIVISYLFSCTTFYLISKNQPQAEEKKK